MKRVLRIRFINTFNVQFITELNIFVFNKQGAKGATAAAHALSLPAEAYGNDVSWNVFILKKFS